MKSCFEKIEKIHGKSYPKYPIQLGCVPKPFFYRFSSSFEPLFDLNDKGHIT
jgi:hypothetical protein